MKKLLSILALAILFISCKKIKNETNLDKLQENEISKSGGRKILATCPMEILGAGFDQVICPGSPPVQLGSPPISGLDYSWSPQIGLSNPNISNPFASPLSSTTYTLTTSSSANLIINGDFEQGNTAFSNDFSYYPGSGVFQQGQYYIATNPFNHNSVWCNTADHTPSGNNLLLLNGLPSGSGSDPAIIWKQNVTIEPNTYIFSAWFLATSTLAANGFAAIQLRVNGVPIGAPLDIHFYNCQWVNLTLPINYTSTNTSALFELINLIPNSSIYNNFGVDDIKLGCPTYTDQVNVTISNNCPPATITTKSFFQYVDCFPSAPSNAAIIPGGNNNYCFYWECGGISHMFSNYPNNQWYINDLPVTSSGTSVLGSVTLSSSGELIHGRSLGDGGPLFKFQVKNTSLGSQQLSPPTYVYYAGYIGPQLEEMGWYKQNYTRNISTPFNNKVGPNAIYTWSVPGCTINDIDNTTPEAIITFPATVPITGITGTLTISNSYCQNGPIQVHFTYNANAQ